MEQMELFKQEFETKHQLEAFDVKDYGSFLEVTTTCGKVFTCKLTPTNKLSRQGFVRDYRTENECKLFLQEVRSRNFVVFG